MRLSVFGATGGVGRHIVAQALTQGHEVTALVRNPAAAAALLDGAKMVEGDALDDDAVSRAIDGQEAAICALGAPPSSKQRVRAQGVKNIMRAMEARGIRRLVCLSSFGVGDSFDHLPFHYRRLIFPLFLRHVMADHNEQEQNVRASAVDWTIVRPVNLTDGPRTGAYRIGFEKPDRSLKFKISRADVADFMLKQLTSDENLRKATSLGN